MNWIMEWRLNFVNWPISFGDHQVEPIQPQPNGARNSERPDVTRVNRSRATHISAVAGPLSGGATLSEETMARPLARQADRPAGVAGCPVGADIGTRY